MLKEDISSGAVYDAARRIGLENFLLSEGIRPLNKDSVIWGPAFTTEGRVIKSGDYEAYDKFRLFIYKHVPEKSVVLLSTKDPDKKVAHSGDITSLLYKQAGAQGFITDGLVRDSKKIREMHFPCFCTGTTPIDAIDYWAIVSYQTPITLPSYNYRQYVVINPGDMIFADTDGAIRIPREKEIEFLTELAEVLQQEHSIRQMIKCNEDPSFIYKVHGRW